MALQDEENGLMPIFRELLDELYTKINHLDRRIVSLEKRLGIISRQSEKCQLLMTGIGLMMAMVLSPRSKEEILRVWKFSASVKIPNA
uniref:Uncharacterized protein n=1 Tax=Candidatus Kentrum sp. TUN TaxID=2126343 RepID=A0A451A2E3_9GAMM|nr:MAG: hypothetical protein BECKTUN1418D_GA0071000_11189 [Candidatus Kentron sp. TUN]